MKSTRNELRQLASIRLREAKALLDAGHHDGAYYLAGLAVECALKACIAKQTQRFDFPDVAVVRDSWNHDLTKLLKTAELKPLFEAEVRRDKSFEENWTVVKDWSIEVRYMLNQPPKKARDLYAAVTTRKSGVLKWIRQHW